MPDVLDLLACLGKLGAFDVTLNRVDPTLALAVVQLPDDRKLLALERTYRSGVYVILDPTDEEMRVARQGDLWRLWNSDRAKDAFDLRQSLESGTPGTRVAASRQAEEAGS